MHSQKPFALSASVIAVLAALLWAGCSDPVENDPPPDGDPADADGGHDADEPRVNYIGVAGVVIESVSIYQGPKCEIMSGGDAIDCGIPIIEGRDALFRVFYTAEANQAGESYRARLTIDDDTFESTGTFGASSTEEELSSTANFIVTGAAINPALGYRVEFIEEGVAEDDNPQARFPSEELQPLDVDGARNTFRVVIAPFAYWADGSGRLPDLSPERVEDYRERFQQLYPVSNVEVTVREPHDWDGVLDRQGNGWTEVGLMLLSFRGADRATDDVYYYGVFNPAEDLRSYCGMSCLLGVTLLNDTPPDTGSVYLRLALGVGFDSVAVNTAAHEIGHAHGRAHAPCGSPDGVDSRYPYPGGLIGVWSWDVVNEELISPDDHTDIMGYCERQWISDYNYIAWYERGRHVNLPRLYRPELPTVSYQVITVRGDGSATIAPGLHQSHTLGGRPLPVRVASADGRTIDLAGSYFTFDHLPGGLLFVPRPTFELVTAEFFVDDRHTIAVRSLLAP